MSENQHQLRAFCEYSRVFKGNTERSVKAYRFEVGAFVDATDTATASEIDRQTIEGEMFDSLRDARQKLALWRYDYNNVRPHSSLGNQTPAEARRTLEQFESSTPGALAQTDDEEYENQTSKLSL